MWFAIAIIFIGASIAHAVYFSRRITGAIEALAPTTRRYLRPARRVYLAIACSLPLLILLYIVYVLVAQPTTVGLPEGTVADVLLVFPYLFVTIWSFQTSLLIVPIGALHWLVRRTGRLEAQPWHRRRHIAVLCIAAVFLVYVPARFAIDGRSLEVRQHDIRIPDLASDLDGFAIALLADPQADRHTGPERIGELVDAVLKANPDLIVVAGDIITRDPAYIEVAAAQLGRLKAGHGVYACIGDHDNFAYSDQERSLREVREGIGSRGIAMLDNEQVAIRVGESELALVLVTNNYINRIGPGTARKLVERARDAAVRVVVAHQAGSELVAQAQRAGAEVFLSGHTPGGQVNFWTPFGSLIFSRIESPYVTGRYEIGDMALIVSSGLGMSVTPFRYRSSATVDIIRLRRGQGRN